MHKLIKTIFNNQIYICLFISIWFCIDTNFENILSLKNNTGIKNIFLSLRAILQLLIAATLSITIFINKNYQHFSSNNKFFNIILIFFSTLFLFQLYGLIVTKNTLINSYYLIVALLSIVFTLVSYNRNLENISYLICLLFLGIILSVYGYLSYDWLFSTSNLQLYGTWPHVYWPIESFSSNVIRSSGLSRSSLIFLIPVFYMLLINHIKYIYFIPYLILCSNIYL